MVTNAWFAPYVVNKQLTVNFVLQMHCKTMKYSDLEFWFALHNTIIVKS